MNWMHSKWIFSFASSHAINRFYINNWKRRRRKLFLDASLSKKYPAESNCIKFCIAWFSCIIFPISVNLKKPRCYISPRTKINLFEALLQSRILQNYFTRDTFNRQRHFSSALVPLIFQSRWYFLFVHFFRWRDLSHQIHLIIACSQMFTIFHFVLCPNHHLIWFDSNFYFLFQIFHARSTHAHHPLILSTHSVLQRLRSRIIFWHHNFSYFAHWGIRCNDLKAEKAFKQLTCAIKIL